MVQLELQCKMVPVLVLVQVLVHTYVQYTAMATTIILPVESRVQSPV